MTNWQIFKAETEFDFGKHVGRTLEEVMSNDAAYILWCIRNIEWFLIDVELLESYVGKHDQFVNAYDSISKKNVEININPFSLSEEFRRLLTDKWNKYNQGQSAIKDNSVNNSRDSFRNNKIKTDKTKLIQRFTIEEQQFNSRLLSTFETMFSANSFHNLKGILHAEGVFFGRMNRDKACGYFYNIFFCENGSSEKFNLEVNRGISMDNKPGEVVLELRCSNFDPFSDNVSIVDKAFGEKPDFSIDETIYRFAFSFKDEKIYSIRVPRKSISENNKLKENN